MIRSHPEILQNIALEFSKAQALEVDTHIVTQKLANVYDGTGTEGTESNKLNDGAAMTLTSANVYNSILEMREVLYGKNVGTTAGNLILYVNPAVRTLIPQSAIFDGSDNGFKDRRNGFLGTIDGIGIVMTNNIP